MDILEYLAYSSTTATQVVVTYRKNASYGSKYVINVRNEASSVWKSQKPEKI